VNKITVICCADDCSSVQSYQCRTAGVFDDITALDVEMPEGFKLIAVVEGWPELKTRDDARTAEQGVL
jgi:hypothetical protein